MSDSNRVLRIVVTGSHSVGKSSLVHDLHRALKQRGVRSVIAEEPIRKLEEKLRGLDRLSLYLCLAGEHFARLETGDVDCCLYDRGLLDLLVYTRLEGPGNPHFEEMLTQVLKWYAVFIDLFFYLPIEIPLTQDRRRPVNENYRIRVDEAIQNVAAEAGIKLITIRGGRSERVMKALNCCLEKRGEEPAALPEKLVDI